MGLGETPSAASGATLGSAAMEYLPAEEPVDDPHRKRRVVAAAVLGVSIAAGLVGAVLIVSTALMKPKEPATLGTPTTQTAPPEAQDPTQPPASVTTPSAPSAAASADPVVPSASPPATTAAPPRTAAAPAAPLPIPTTTTAAATTHRNTPPAAPTVRPKAPPPPPPPTGTKPPERGF